MPDTAVTPETPAPPPPAAPPAPRLVVETYLSAFALPTTEASGAKTGRQCEVAIIKAGTSKNRNVWKGEVLTKALPMFEGVKVYVDHKGDYERSAKELVGQITCVRMAGEVMVGTLTSVAAGEGKWFREMITDPLGVKLLGLSVYVFACAKTTPDGCEEMIEVASVRSVDVVHDPSAGGGVLAVTEATKEVPPPAAPAPEATTPPAATEGAGNNPEPRKEDPVTEQEIKAIQEQMARTEQENVKLRTEAKAQSDRLAKLESARITDEALIRARAAGKDIKPAAEAQIRAGLAQLAAVSTDVANQVVETVLAQVEALRKEYAPAPTGAGIPPAAPVNEAAVADAKRKVQLATVGYIFAGMGVEMPEHQGK